jgi:hypothetical protein
MTNFERCPSCSQMRETLPSGFFAVCGMCGERCCADCLPGGEGRMCKDCKRGDRDEAPDLSERPA